MKQKITETVYEWDRDRKEGFRFESYGMLLKDFKEVIKNIDSLIPDGYKNSAIIDIHSEGYEYGSSSLEFEVRYIRDETDEEEEIREKSILVARRSQKELDIIKIERLKKKWGL